MKNLQVRNMESSRGNLVPNQFIISINGCVYFQSYQSIIAKVENGCLTLGRDWDYSRTTSKYLHSFLLDHCYKFARLSKKQIQSLIDSGDIKYIPEETWS